MDVREKLVELLADLDCNAEYCKDCEFAKDIDGCVRRQKEIIADRLIAHGVTVQDDMTELIGKGLDNIYWRIYGANKEFNERMAGYTPSAFCAGFEYAIQLAKGLLTQLPKPPKGE